MATSFRLGVGGFGVGGTVAFYRNDGTLDASFGSGGESDFATMAPVALAFQPSGQIVVIGSTVNAAGGQGPSVLTRLNADGSLDTGFGQGGFAYDDGSETPESPNALASLPGGMILEGATTTDTQDGISGILFELDRYIAPTSISTPTINWANPADIVYGTALGATQLDATATVSGTFAYTPAAGTILNAGNNQTLSATFTPTDTTDYSTVTPKADINVTQATPTITWANPADIVYGTGSERHPARRHGVVGRGRSDGERARDLRLLARGRHDASRGQQPDAVSHLHTHRHGRLHGHHDQGIHQRVAGDADDDLGRSCRHHLPHAARPGTARRLGLGRRAPSRILPQRERS